MPADPETTARLRDMLVASENEFSNEVIPGVVLPHARLRGLPASVVVIGVSPTGVSCPGAARPVRLFVLLASPASRPDEHLRRLAGIARFLRSPERVAALLARLAPDVDADWLEDDPAGGGHEPPTFA